MIAPEIYVYSDPEQLSRKAAEFFAATATARLEVAGSFCAALSGGTTPRRLYELLATPEFSDRIAWRNTHLFQVDERCVPPDHPESNFKMLRETLLMPARIPRECFHRMAGEASDSGEAARTYALEMARVMQSRNGDFPRFDLVILGMGSDGHTASLFPGSAGLDETTGWVVPNQPTQGGLKRITLTFPVLNAAARVLFLVSGQEKAATLRKVLEGPSQSRVLPAQGIKPLNGSVSWYIDRAAGSALTGVSRSDG